MSWGWIWYHQIEYYCIGYYWIGCYWILVGTIGLGTFLSVKSTQVKNENIEIFFKKCICITEIKTTKKSHIELFWNQIAESLIWRILKFLVAPDLVNLLELGLLHWNLCFFQIELVLFLSMFVDEAGVTEKLIQRANKFHNINFWI